MQTFQIAYNLLSPVIYILIGYFLGQRGISNVVTDVKNDITVVKADISAIKNYFTPVKPVASVTVA